MIGIVLTLAGLAMLVYSIFLCLSGNKIIKKIIATDKYLYLQLLIYIFVLGYIFFAWYLAINMNKIGFIEIVVSLVFFFGAIFVVFIFQINKALLEQINQHTSIMDANNKNLEELNNKLADSLKKLEESKKKYKDKSVELEDALEGVYMLRIKLAEFSGSEDMKKENELIKDKIDELKKE